MAFGNSEISTSPVYDEYLRSQADVYGNSFSNPMNPANMNSGWSINSSLLSPSYTAPFRPEYSGAQPGAHYGRPTFGQSFNALNPLSDDVMWGNPHLHQRRYIESMVNRPMDAAAWGMQRIAMPVAGMWAAGKLMGGFNGFGMAKGAYSAGRNFGAGIGTGISKSFGLGRSGAMLSKGLGAVGGIAAGYAAPIAAMQGMMWGAEKAIFNPYMNNRRTSEDFRTNFAGITFGDGMGHSVTGGGFGSQESYRLASQVTHQGIGDMALSTGQYGAGASMIMRSGMLDNANVGDMTRRIKESMQQVKLIMSIASMPEMKDAVEQLAKLQQMGASTLGGASSVATSSISQLGKFAAIAGTSVQRMMNTVGAQGQYLYQANGMTPYLGQMAAANSYAALSAGNRMGLISPAQLARLGGLEGATQASLTGQINVSQTLFNKIGNFNQYMNGGRTDSMVGNLNKFGQTMAGDPMGVYGSMMIHGRQMAGRQMEERGSLAIEDQLYQIAKNLPGMMGKNGKITLERAVPLLMQMGMSEDQIHSWATQRVSEQDQGAYNLKLKSMNRNLTEQSHQYISQHGLYGGAFGSTVHRIRRGGRVMTSGIASALVDPVSEWGGSVVDSATRMMSGVQFSDTIGNDELRVEDILGGKPHPARNGNSYRGFIDPSENRWSTTGIFNRNRFQDATSVASRLNALAQSGDANAQAYFKATTQADKNAALRALMKTGSLDTSDRKIKGNYGDRETFNELTGELNKMRVGDKLYDPTLSIDKSEKFRKELYGITGLKTDNFFDSMETIGLAFDLATSQGVNAENIDDQMKSNAELQKFAKKLGLTSSDDILAAMDKINVGGSKSGFTLSGTVAYKMNSSGYKTDADKMKALAERAPLRANAFLNADEVDKEHAIGVQLAAKEDAEMRVKAYDQLKSGRVDFGGYQSTINALDNKKSITKFDDAVTRFEKAINDKWYKGWFGDDGSSTPRNANVGTRQNNQRTVGAGN